MQPASLALLFDTDDFSPRWLCGNFSDVHGWTHIVADSAIFGAYAAIPAVITYFVLKRRDVELPSLWWLFAAFIFSCGFGHLVDATLFWQPWYRFSALVKVFTAMVSWGTVLALAHYLPVALAMPGAARLTAQLQRENDERKQTEASLRESEERFRALISATSQIVWTTNADGQVEEPSPTWCAFTGQSEDQRRGWGWVDALHPLDREPVQRAWREAVKRQEPFRTECRLHHAGGEWRWMSVNGVPWRHPDGGVRGWVGMNTDITERKRAEQALRESEALKGAVLNAALDCIITMDSTGRITEFNPAAERTFGRRRGEVLGRPLAETIIPPAMREAHRAGFERFQRTRQSSLLGKRVEMTAVRANGGEFPVELSIVAIPDVEPPLFAGFLRDITDRRRAEDALRASLQEKEILLREIHHRVKNNMQVVSSILKLQSAYVRDPEAREMFAECQDRVRTLALVHEKLYRSANLAAIDFGGHIRDLTTMLVRSYSAGAPNTQVSVHTDPAVVDIDTAVPLGLILNELLTNALKYAFPQGRAGVVEVTLRAKPDVPLQLTVRDNGVGLPDGFDPMQSQTLGLKIVTSLCRQLQAELQVDREEGAAFTVTLGIPSKQDQSG
jgi:PAS domain S-box-containing protein